MPSTALTYTKSSYRSGNNPAEVTTSQTFVAHNTALEDKIRLLQEDLEYERELRQRVEREKSDFSVQVIQLQERIEEVEAGADGQIEINRKRDAELAKLRKLLEDVHLEAEQTQHLLKKKHQEAVVDFQDQVDILTKAKSKIEKERSKFQTEVYELTEQLERATVEAANNNKSIKSLNIVIQELNIKIEELNRTVVDLTSNKQRISVENIELHKSVQELKVKIEEITYISKNASSNVEEFRRKYEEEERRRRKLEADIAAITQELATLRSSYDEECELRLDIERKYSNECANANSYKSKWEIEVRGRQEEVEEIKKKMLIRITELEETISSLTTKLSGVEKQKSRLSQEIEVLILDLEKANNNHREVRSRLEIVEREHRTLIVKHEELSVLYDQSCKDLKIRSSDLTKALHDLETLKEQYERIHLEHKKLSNENGDLKATVNDLTRLKHDLELEIRRLESERNELANALHESEAARKDEETRFLKMSSEYSSYRTETERRLQAKEDEIDTLRKTMAQEVDALNARVVEAETRLKSEVTKIKKKMQITITELEMHIDTVNKSNIDLQRINKKVTIQLQELQTHYDELQRQLQQTLDQYGVAQRRLQQLIAENEEFRANLEAASRARRNAELQLEECLVRIKDLTTINANISATKSKLEQEISVIASDYDEVTKELRLADERLLKANTEVKRVTESLHEESERCIKIESIRKSLEVEVRNLTVRIENIEVNSLANTKRMVAKLESRVADLENELDEERRRHQETIKILKKKERNVKELVLQCEEDHKNIQILQETLDKTYEKVNLYKRQIGEQESISQTNLSRVRRFQRELETAEERAETAESNLSMIRSKHRTFVTSQTTTLPTGEHVIIKETVTTE
ncbi:paramyosin, long form isoform X2 [Hyalella azteca]|uniref:Paramyosin, long form isoform X2 n=1 Tax=Hyalella azteca TaxID=294128 RepID=A0A8B7NZF8_HYAAZ|nr:paramyosin, long form isoform X2 [Hyalella azteca]